MAQRKLNGRKFMGNVLNISHVKYAFFVFVILPFIYSIFRPEEKCVLKVTNLPFSTDEKVCQSRFRT